MVLYGVWIVYHLLENAFNQLMGGYEGMNFINGRKYSALRIAAVLACVAWAIIATGIQVSAGTPFSFVAIGDTRTEPYLTGGMEQAEVMGKRAQRTLS